MTINKPTLYRICALAAVLLVILLSVFACSWLATNALMPDSVDKSGRSLLNADYSPWGFNTSLDINIPGLATAASRGDSDWNAGNLPAPTFTIPPQEAAAQPPPTAQPTTTLQILITRVPPQPTATDGNSTTGGGGGTCGSPCTTSADCVGLACFGGVCWDAQICEPSGVSSGGGSSGVGNGGGSSGGNSDGGSCACSGICTPCP